jgi:hypothetical protein
MSCDYDKEYKCGDSLYDLTKKILGRLKEIVGLGGGGGGGGDVTLTVSDVEIGAVEIKDSTTDNRATVRNSDPDPTDYGIVVRNIPSGTQAVSGPFLTNAELRAAAVPISVATLPLPAGAATEATLATMLTLAGFQARINTLGQKTMAASTPVVIASDQSAIAVTGPLTDAQLRAAEVPISAASLPLPAGAATEATLTGVLTTAAFGARVNTLGQKTMAASTPVVLASNQSSIPVTQSGTWSVFATQSGTWNVGQSGTWTVQPGNTQNTTPWLVDQAVGSLWQVQAAQAGAWSVSATQSGTWTVNQGGFWTVSAAQSGAWTVAATQSGVWTVQPGDTQNTVPWLTANDWRRNAIPKRYSITVTLTPGAATAGTNLFGLRKLNANADCHILRIRVHVYHAAAGVACVLGWRRATPVAAGSQVTAADIPKHDTSAGNATLEVRTGAVTGTEANQFILIHPAHTTAAPASGVGSPWIDEWRANDRAGSIRLTGDEGLILEQTTAGDTDNRYVVMVEWEEV